MKAISSNTLLSYSLDTMPSPLQASPAKGETVYGALSFVVSNGGSSVVLLSQLQFTVPIGALAQDLTANAGAILWTTSPSTLWNVSMTSPGIFLLVPASGQPIPVSSDGMIIQFYNILVNQQVGTVSITVNETASNTGNPSQVRTAAFSVAKFPYGFYFSNFTAQVPLVRAGGTVTLIWQGSDNATYSMRWSEAPPADVTNVRSWVSPALSNDTSFLLRATIVSQGETVTTDLSTTVIVANPEIQATSLQVTGVSNLQGATTIGTGSTQATVNGKLTVTGPTLLSGTTTLSGNATATNLAVTGTLTFGNTTAFNNVVVNGTFAAIKNPQAVGQGTYSARTDGILLASMKTPFTYPVSGAWGWIFIKTPWYEYKLSGGDCLVKMYADAQSGGSSISVPIQKGQSCSVTFKSPGYPYGTPEMKVFFVPFGNIPQAGDAFVKISDEVPAYALPEPPVPKADPIESIADALFEAVKSGDKQTLVSTLKDILIRH